MDLAHADKAFRKLSKTLRSLPDRPSIEEVHELRNQVRRFEAVADTLELSHDRRMTRLLKAIKRIRKAAGTVRDMDVLSEDSLILSREGGDRQRDRNSVLRLLHYLHSTRIQKARALTEAVKERRKEVWESLKLLCHEFKKQRKADADKDFSTGAVREREAAAVMDLLLDLRLWPELSEENLHRFRLKVKNLRILMQLVGGAESTISADLGKTKDLIGDWHDWCELHGIAKKVLTAKRDRPLVSRIQEIAGKKMKSALASAEALLDRHIRFNSSRKAV